MKLCFSLVVLLFCSLSFIVASETDFDKKLVSIVRYAWNQASICCLRDDVEFSFDFDNYEDWVKSSYEQDLLNLRHVHFDLQRSLPPQSVYHNFKDRQLGLAHGYAMNTEKMRYYFERGFKMHLLQIEDTVKFEDF
jgi:hypothetical protein